MILILAAPALMLLAPTALAHTVTIGKQVWMKKNLDVSTYRNGDIIPQVNDIQEWSSLRTGAWCYYENNAANGKVYGKLYNWYAVNVPRGLAPAGFHIPTEAEWETLTTFLDGDDGPGKKMKSASGWGYQTEFFSKICQNCKDWSTEYQKKVPCHTCKDTRSVGSFVRKVSNGSNSTAGFSGLPGGGLLYYGWTFDRQGYSGYWWSSSEYDIYNAWYRDLNYNSGHALRHISFKVQGLSVRCLRD